MTTDESRLARKRAGAEHLERQSALRKRVRDEAIHPVILLVENERLDVHFIETPLKRLFGAETRIDVVQTVAALRKAVAATTYDVLLLDDRMDEDATAEATLKMVRDRQPDMPVIVFSRMMTRTRHAELQRLNCHSIHGKEDLDSVVLGAAILTALGHKI